jgi:type II secretory pathway pseudopilin PulG
MKLSNKNGFTLIEVLFAATILISCLVGLLATYLNMLILSDLMRDATLANAAVQSRMEVIKRADFDNLYTFNNSLADIEGMPSADAKTRVEVHDTSYADLKRIRVLACFKSRARTIGNSINDCTSSPVELVTLISR